MTSPSTLLGDVKPMRVITDRGEGNMHAKPPIAAAPERPPETAAPETAAEKPEVIAFGTDAKDPVELPTTVETATPDQTESDIPETPIPGAAPLTCSRMIALSSRCSKLR